MTVRLYNIAFSNLMKAGRMLSYGHSIDRAQFVRIGNHDM